ncbi:MAG TPA: hypothetical protein VLU24_03755, partial [Mycobacterium sp.]|nr:hypothetical protein [Mycobacterium sp.]
MSPRRKIEPGDDFVVTPVTKRTWRGWLRGARGLPGLSIAASLLVVAGVVMMSLMLWYHASDDRAGVRNA